LQIEKIVLFLLQQQGHLASRIENLGEQHAALMEQSDVAQICQLREAYRDVGYDLVKLLRFVDMNATGIQKILKKFDKRFEYKFTDYYVSTRANHPYSQLQQIIKQVVHSSASTSFFNFIFYGKKTCSSHDAVCECRVWWLLLAL
jgi:SPX domain protein involved in polyphosphate accumulation